TLAQAEPLGLGLRESGLHAVVLRRGDAREPRERGVEVVEQLTHAWRARLLVVAAQQPGHGAGVRRPERREREVARRQTWTVDELGSQVQDVRDATRHARREVAARPARDEHDAAGHVLAAVVADALDDERRTGVAD